MSPFDELTELRSVLKVQEIAEMTGLRRETLSRARPGRRFQRRTERALDDLYRVVTQLRATVGGDPSHLVAILRRPQASLDHRSIADLLREGKADEALRHLPTRGRPGRKARRKPLPDEEKQRAAELLAADPELAERLPAVEEAIRRHFGADAAIERGVIWACGPGEEDELHVRIDSPLSLDEELDRLIDLIGERIDEEERLGRIRDRMTIGFS